MNAKLAAQSVKSTTVQAQCRGHSSNSVSEGANKLVVALSTAKRA